MKPTASLVRWAERPELDGMANAWESAYATGLSPSSGGNGTMLKSRPFTPAYVGSCHTPSKRKPTFPWLKRVEDVTFVAVLGMSFWSPVRLCRKAKVSSMAPESIVTFVPWSATRGSWVAPEYTIMKKRQQVDGSAVIVQTAP